jgi:FixJ family two-component response regulator
MTKVVHVVDDDGSFRQATARLLRTAGYIVVEHETADALLTDLPDGADPGCLLLDVSMPGLSGLELQEKLRAARGALPIVFLTGHGDIPMSVRAIKLGAEDFLIKPVGEEQLFDAIERAIARHTRTRAQQARLEELHLLVGKLTPREREVFEQVVRGRQNKQIAFDLGTTARTIKAHRQRVMQKLGAKSLIELVSIARTVGSLPDDVRDAAH